MLNAELIALSSTLLVILPVDSETMIISDINRIVNLLRIPLIRKERMISRNSDGSGIAFLWIKKITCYANFGKTIFTC